MNLTPHIAGRRIEEDEIVRALARHFQTSQDLTHLLFAHAFGEGLQSLHDLSILKGKHVDYRARDGRPELYGEDDLGIVATAAYSDGSKKRIALLIETKIDAPLMDQQAARYRHRADLRVKSGEFDDYRTAFVAPAFKIKQLYPLGDHLASWDRTFSFEELAKILIGINRNDAQLFLDATVPENHFQEPNLSAVRFWKDYEIYAKENYQDVPVTIRTNQGSRVGAWPSFYDHLFFKNKIPGRKRLQIAYPNNFGGVRLYVKNVSYEAFRREIEPLLETDMLPLKPGKTWQGALIETSQIDPRMPINEQLEVLPAAFDAARRFHDFFVRHETQILGLIVAESTS